MAAKVPDDVWVVIPAYNEKRHILEVIKATKRFASNIVVVDDGSKDNTTRLALAQGVTVLQMIVNLGKGAALKTGCDFALRQGAKRIVVMDSDGQHNPARIPEFVDALKGKDIVFGIRSMDENMPAIKRFGNAVINKVTELLYRIKIDDTQTGFRAFTSNAYSKIRWRSSDYSMESEMIANAGKHHLKYAEIGIETITHDRYRGTTILDGIKIVANMVLWRLKWY
ncbi:MAG TPA: glycosyltransferase family 2 protein [Candidatus Nanoarchaeia archaeon]|nr:glycosyltransferase family 2 protein [Candidatus Nanoarchaeia archaeon]